MSASHLLTHDKRIEWIDIFKPNDVDRAILTKRFHFDNGDVQDAFRSTARSKITQWENYIFLVLLVPVYNKKTHTIDIDEIDCFIGKNFLITVHQKPLPPVRDLFQRCEKALKNKKTDTAMASTIEHLVFELIDDIQEYVYPMIDHINGEIDELKKSIFNEAFDTRKMVKQILRVRRNITDMRRALRGHSPILTHLIKKERKEHALSIVEHPALFEDLIDYSNEIWHTLESHKETIEALEDANDALISHSLNETMRALTAFSAVLLPAGVIAGLFGMNATYIPFAQHPAGFFIFAGTTLFVSILITFLFWKKRWLK